VARKLDSFPSAASQRYPWQEWLDGGVWQLFEGEDFTSKTTTLIGSGRARAKRQGGNLRTRMVTDEGRSSVVLQFVK